MLEDTSKDELSGANNAKLHSNKVFIDFLRY